MARFRPCVLASPRFTASLIKHTLAECPYQHSEFERHYTRTSINNSRILVSGNEAYKSYNIGELKTVC